MRVLTATNELQGTAPGDYCFTVEGELVIADVVECAHPDRCGCGRGFPGVSSHRATTTAQVVDLPHIGLVELRGAVRDHVESGWSDLVRNGVSPDDPDPDRTVDEHIEAITDEYVESIVVICSHFPAGTTIERNGTIIQARSTPAAA